MTLVEQIDRAWELRTGRRIQECLGVVSSIRQQLNISCDNITIEKLHALAESHPWLLVSKFAVLQASLAGILRGPKEAYPVLHLADRFIRHYQSQCTYDLAYERGRTAFLEGRFAFALEEFTLAAELASSAAERARGLVNVVFCFENMGMETLKSRETLERALSEVPRDSCTYEIVQSQLDAFFVRTEFRSGRLAALVAPGRPAKECTQALYHKLYYRQLPYHRYFHPKVEIEPGAMLGSEELLNRHYLWRTLLGVLHPDDAFVSNVSERCDRIYLWTWRWLVSPESLPAKRLGFLLDQCVFSDLDGRMTVEDTVLLRNALLWLSLFDYSAEAQIQSRIAELHIPSNEPMPVLELESLLIHYFLAKRDRNDVLAHDLKQAIVHHPLFASEELFFPALFRASEGNAKDLAGVLGALGARIASTIQGVTDDGVSRVVVDLARSSIEDKLTGEKIVSEPLVAALDLLHAHPQVPCAQFLELVFGYSHYEPDIHLPKIHNLLTRLKRLCRPEINFRVKMGSIIAAGNWSKVQFAGDRMVSKQLGALPWSSFFGKRQEVPDKASGRSSRPDWAGALTRHQVEKFLGRPRSTTNRLLSRWMDKGVVAREGHGKQVFYRVKSPATNKFSEVRL